MMSYHDHKALINLGQKEALLNEYKGNLFEYLVAKEVASNLKIESFFLAHLSIDLLNRLRLYQETLLEYDQNLYRQLPVLANAFVTQIISNWNSSKKEVFTRVDEIYLLGKIEANSGERLWKEADIVLRNSKDSSFELPISLKLCKKGSFTNTKSAGIMSFFSNYFNKFDELYPDSESVLLRQKRYNFLIDNSFEQMALLLHREKNLPYEGGFHRPYLEKYSDLPGELEGRDREILMDHYKRLAQGLVVELKELNTIDAELFKHCLFDLMGFSSSHTLLWTCFHHEHQFVSAHEDDMKSLVSANFLKKNVEFYPLEGAGSVNIKILDNVLQLRIKPMNKFTTKAYKINCSVKW